MRLFGSDAPDFFVFQIEGSEETYKIPLAGSMTNRQILEFEATQGDYRKQLDWLRGYVGDIVDDLTVSQTSDIIRAWSHATKEQGAEPGES